jgi:hypothetical protein
VRQTPVRDRRGVDPLLGDLPGPIGAFASSRRTRLSFSQRSRVPAG